MQRAVAGGQRPHAGAPSDGTGPPQRKEGQARGWGVAGTQDVSLTLGPELQTDRWKGFQGLGGAESHRWGVVFEVLGVASERSALHGDLGTRAEGTAGGLRMRWAQRRRVRWRRPHRGGGRGGQAPPPPRSSPLRTRSLTPALCDPVPSGSSHSTRRESRVQIWEGRFYPKRRKSQRL